MTNLISLAERVERDTGGQQRDYRGRFLRKLKPTPDGSREWLIWSKYWNAWHRRSESGGACGYTGDIAEAGLFPRSKAASYNDDRNTPMHVSEVMDKIQASIAERAQQADELQSACLRSLARMKEEEL